MRLAFIVFLLLLITSTVNIAAQDVPCAQPYAFLFEEFVVKDLEHTRSRLTKLFERLVNEDPNEAKVTVFFYAGQKSKIREPELLASQIDGLLDKHWPMKKNRISVLDGGYRSEPTIEIYIRPLLCSTYPSHNSAFTVEEVELEEAPRESTLTRSSDELSAAIAKKTELPCPPAARAVWRCDGDVVIRVLINEKGDIIFARTVSGPPLLRGAAVTAVRKWTFRPFKHKGAPAKVLGNITVKFEQPADDNGN